VLVGQLYLLLQTVLFGDFSEAEVRSLFTTETHDLEVCCQRVYACISLLSGHAVA